MYETGQTLLSTLPNCVSPEHQIFSGFHNGFLKGKKKNKKKKIIYDFPNVTKDLWHKIQVIGHFCWCCNVVGVDRFLFIGVVYCKFGV
ncbi:hypothetical protein HanRHA438_Chr16g0749641 [Helianthus annuus]|nr:hypothetical protein HanRHA438_Chr16g0749641 [Helianthus annuus]